MSSTGSMTITVTKMTASSPAAMLRPTFSVPGMVSSAILPWNLRTAVVGANEPIPSVSKNANTSPTGYSMSSGRLRPV